MSTPSRRIINIASANDAVAACAPDKATESSGLYEVRQKIYPRALSGWFAGWRWTLVWFTQLLFYGMPWITLHGRPAIVFDLAARKFYVGGFVFWPQDFIYLALLLIAAALSLFLFTAVGGRLWCGFACPQTVYTEIFLFIERHVEGNRHQQMRLDQGPKNLKRLVKKTTKHALWIMLALFTGVTFVGYFTPIRQLASEILSFSVGPWEGFWITFYAFATYGNAGFMREQVCKYMCPYARFQSAMFDKDTLIVTYDSERGEPRGARARRADRIALAIGDCINCGICVEVCPTGIDIREGLQYECIGCAACVDGCNQIMAKMNYAPGLIRFTTEHALAGRWSKPQLWQRVFRPRVLVYCTVLLALVSGTTYSLATRVPLQMDVMRDRKELARVITDENQPTYIENTFRLHVMNMDEHAHHYQLSVSGLPGIKLETQGDLFIEPTAARTIAVSVRVPQDLIEHGSHPIALMIESVDQPRLTRIERAVFLPPLEERN